MNETIEFKSGQQGYVEYKSSNPFEFYHILNELDKLIDSSQDKQEFKTGVYNMNIKTDYAILKSKLKIAFDEYL